MLKRYSFNHWINCFITLFDLKGGFNFYPKNGEKHRVCELNHETHNYLTGVIFLLSNLIGFLLYIYILAHNFPSLTVFSTKFIDIYTVNHIYTLFFCVSNRSRTQDLSLALSLPYHPTHPSPDVYTLLLIFSQSNGAAELEIWWINMS